MCLFVCADGCDGCVCLFVQMVVMDVFVCLFVCADGCDGCVQLSVSPHVQ